MIKKSGIEFSYNFKKQEGVTDFNKELFPNHFLSLIIGKPGSGKTALVKFLLQEKSLMYKKFDFVYIISPSFVEYDCLFLPNENFYNELDFEWIETKIENLKDTESYINVLFILDDVIADLFKNRFAKEIMSFVFNRRHLLNNGMISIIITSQKYTFVPTAMRANITSIYMFLLNGIEFMKIKKEIIFNEKEFEKVLKMVFGEEPKTNKNQAFILYRIDNNTYFKNFDKIILNKNEEI